MFQPEATASRSPNNSTFPLHSALKAPPEDDWDAPDAAPMPQAESDRSELLGPSHDSTSRIPAPYPTQKPCGFIQTSTHFAFFCLGNVAVSNLLHSSSKGPRVPPRKNTKTTKTPQNQPFSRLTWPSPAPHFPEPRWFFMSPEGSEPSVENEQLRKGVVSPDLHFETWVSQLASWLFGQK